MGQAKPTLLRPGQALKFFQQSETSGISIKSSHEGGKVVSPTHRPPLPSSKYSWYSFLSEAESTIAIVP